MLDLKNHGFCKGGLVYFKRNGKIELFCMSGYKSLINLPDNGVLYSSDKIKSAFKYFVRTIKNWKGKFCYWTIRLRYSKVM